VSKLLSFLGGIFPPLGAGLVGLKAVLFSAKGAVWLVFGILVAWLLLAHSCHHKPTVEFVPTPDPTPAVINKAVENTDQVVHDDQVQAAKTDTQVQQVKVATHKKIKAIKADKTLTRTQQVYQIGQAQLDQMNSMYSQYFGTPSNSSSPNGTAPTSTPHQSSSGQALSLNTITITPPASMTA
jgi:hypothetical protein